MGVWEGGCRSRRRTASTKTVLPHSHTPTLPHSHTPILRTCVTILVCVF